MVSIKLEGLEQLDALQERLKDAPKRIERKVKAVNRSWVGKLRAAILSRAPRQTGRYHSAMDVHTADGGLSVEAGNPLPYSDRLEYGFAGVDSLGRHYHQAARPHFRPALEESGPRYAKDLEDALGDWLD